MNRLAIAFLLFLSACATTQGTSRLVSIPQSAVLAQFSKLTVKVEAAKDISLGTVDKERISNLIVQHIKTDSPERFVTINQDVLTPGALLASVMITKYDEGNAFARAMLAGLGQMLIDAEIILNDAEKKEEIARYAVNKTFAWGGLYGGFTGMKDVEDGFANAVEILHRRYYEGKPERLADLEKARGNDQIARKIVDLRTQTGLSQR